MKYWHIDTADYITLVLMDKSYYDYDYEVTKKPQELRAPKTAAEQQSMFSRFGFGRVKSSGVTAEDIQQAINDIEKNV